MDEKLALLEKWDMIREQVKIEYFGHSCFRLSGLGQRVVLDPYADGSVPGCPDLRLDAEFVYCSHAHRDHNASECVRICGGGAPKFALTELETDHDDAGGSKRGKNTIRIFDFDGIRVAVFGDLGRALTARELIKGTVLQNSPVTAREALDTLYALKAKLPK